MGASFANCPAGLLVALLLRCAVAAGPKLCVEYLPLVVYDDEPITACARIEGAGAFKLTARLLDRAGHATASHTASGSAAPKKPWHMQCRLRPRRREPVVLELSLSRAKGAEPVGGLKVRVVNLTRPLPPLEVKGLRLVGEEGQAAVLRIAHRVWRREERWPLVRWIRYKLYGDRVAFERVAVVGEDLGADRDGYLATLAPALDGLKVSAVSIPSQARGKGPAVVRAVAAASQRTWRTVPELVVLSLGHSEDDLGTDPVVFGRALEALVQHFEKLGSRHFALVGPVGPPGHEGRLAKYAAQARRVAHTYGARYADLGSAVAGSWGAGDAPATLRFPNQQGQARLGAALADFIRGLRR